MTARLQWECAPSVKRRSAGSAWASTRVGLSAVRAELPRNELNWFWIALALTVPPVAGGLVALPLWLRGEPIFGNLVGTAVIFGAALALILRERVELDRLAQRCLDQGFVCWPDPSAFTRYAIYSFIALLEGIVLFSFSLKVETKVRRRGYAPEWR